MDYHLYYHDDLDGITSGAVLFDFFQKQGDTFTTFTPLDYHASLNASWKNFEFQKPFAMVDFQYHPLAEWWIDHHESAFKFPEWREAYRDDAQHHYDPKAPSCCGLVIRFLKEQHGYEVSREVEQLAVIVDEDDSAGYPTIEKALEMDSPHKQIQLLMSDPELRRDRHAYVEFREFLIRNIVKQGLEKIVELPQYAPRIKELQEKRRLGNMSAQSLVSKRGNVIFGDQSEENSRWASRWAHYQAFPTLPYSLSIQSKGGEYKVSVGFNKWSGTTLSIDLGKIAQRYGGGGHPGIGAINVGSKEDAHRIAEEIIKELNG